MQRAVPRNALDVSQNMSHRNSQMIRGGEKLGVAQWRWPRRAAVRAVAECYTLFFMFESELSRSFHVLRWCFMERHSYGV